MPDPTKDQERRELNLQAIASAQQTRSHNGQDLGLARFTVEVSYDQGSTTTDHLRDDLARLLDESGGRVEGLDGVEGVWKQ